MADYSAFCVNQSKLLPRVEVSIIRYLLLVVRCWLLVVRYSLFVIRYSLFGLSIYIVGWAKVHHHIW